MKKTSVSIYKAEENNLKQVSVDIPHQELTAITGVSGSGKSTLAFHTLFAEGQRRYIETFSPYTRQFLKKVKKPQAESIQNIKPAVAIEQKTRITSSRSSVGSLTGITEYLKLLWANCANATCPDCGIKRNSYPAVELSLLIERRAKLLKRPFIIAVPIAFPKTKKAKGEEIERLIVLGYHRYFNQETGRIQQLDDDKKDLLSASGTLYVVLERQKSDNIKIDRIKEAVSLSYSLSGGLCCLIDIQKGVSSQTPWLRIINKEDNPQERNSPFSIITFSRSGDCPYSLQQLPEPHVSLFSTSHPAGACQECQGFGHILAYDPERIIPDQRKSIEEKAIHCWSTDSRKRNFKKLLEFCKTNNIPTDIPWRELGTGDTNEIFSHNSRAFKGIDAFLKRLERKSYKMHVRVFLSKYRKQIPCSACQGSRLSAISRSFKIDGKSLADAYSMPIADLFEWMKTLRNSSRSTFASKKIQEVFDALLSRLEGLLNLGLPYITLHRPARTLSGGETQRVNLAAALGSGLSSTIFVLDEPSVGLHPRDSERLQSVLHTLKSQGNSVVVVEHDPDLILSSDHIIELGPGAGEYGGNILYDGNRNNWPADNLQVTIPKPQKRIDPNHCLVIENAAFRNLKNISVHIPYHGLSCITGVSGSGKSTLVSDVLLHNWHRYQQDRQPERCHSASFSEDIQDLVLVDQSPLAKSPRANVATYTKMWDLIRTRFSETEAAKQRTLSRSAFSFNTAGGRCETCKGAGALKEDMQFLNDIYIVCDVCLGKRFNAEVLEVRYKGHSIHDVLQLTVQEAATLFHDIPKVVGSCDLLTTLGLNHLTMGHSLSELSGGEAQRLRLISYLSSSLLRPSLLVFDEPTTGLHVQDVTRLLSLFNELIEMGHSILCVEHNLQVIAAADWIIDLGPEGGAGGGQCLFMGSQRSFRFKKTQKISYTADALARYIKEQGAGESCRSDSGPRDSLPLEESIRIHGAREHNLKNISTTLPLQKIVAFTGVSGSGKSSLARDIVFVEGQRRFLDCLSPYARQYIKELTRPEVDHIEGIPPPISIGQHTVQASRLSTIATVSEVYTYIRLLFCKAGTQYCPEHPTEAIGETDPEYIARRVQAFTTRIKILAPIIKGRKGSHKAIFERAIQQDYSEIRLDGSYLSPAKALEEIDPNKQHTIEYVLASITPSRVPEDIVKETVQLALQIGNGTMLIVDKKGDTVISQERTCPQCARGFYKLDPEDLSFNSRRGRCPHCKGKGRRDNGTLCKSCDGSRLNETARHMRIEGYGLHDLMKHTPADLKDILPTLCKKIAYKQVFETIIPELESRLKTLLELGLEYLPLERDCTMLSSGELQRLRVATAIGSPLSGVLYIFDEPSASLHPNDNKHVLKKLREIQERGNTVYLIEHDAESILSADHVVDIGPAGGTNGGTIVYNGPLSGFKKSNTTTANTLYKSIFPSLTSVTEKDHTMTIRHAYCHNVAIDELTIPLEQLVVFAGVSGAGKSSLVQDIVARSWETVDQSRKGVSSWTFGDTEITVTRPLIKIIEIDQKPIGKNIRSTPASYLGIFTEIRKLFAASIEARALGYSPSYFSYATGKGRCSTCNGMGLKKLEMNFLPDARVQCPSCHGDRYTPDTLAIKFHDRSIAEILAMTFEEARELFSYHKKIHRVVHTVCDLGLGYLSLGQGSPTLSGGESQRLKLARELSKNTSGHTLFILDEPSIGLHRSDIHLLVKALQRLTARGHSVWTIEHDESILASADHIIELGPGPGPSGGEIIFEGAPVELVNQKTPWGKLLASYA